MSSRGGGPFSSSREREQQALAGGGVRPAEVGKSIQGMVMLQATALKKETENVVGSEPVVPKVRHPEAHRRTGWRAGRGGLAVAGLEYEAGI